MDVAATNVTENEGVGTELCSLIATNCHGAGGQCAGGSPDRQRLDRLRVFMPPKMVDVGCAGGESTAASPLDDGDGAGGESIVGAAGSNGAGDSGCGSRSAVCFAVLAAIGFLVL